MPYSERQRALVLLVAAAAGWAMMALLFEVLGEARWESVLWTFLGRVFVVLALAASTVALAMIASRMWRETHHVVRIVRSAPGASAILVAAGWATVFSAGMMPGLLLLAGVIGTLISIHHQQPPGGDGVFV